MTSIRKFFVVVAVVLAVNAAPVAAYAGPVSDSCQDINSELKKYGWSGNLCIFPDPTDPDPTG